MLTPDPKKLYDGFNSLRRGVDSSRPATQLARDQVAFAVNTNFRGDLPQCRPGWRKVDLQFLDEDEAVDATLQDNFENAKFQRATYYSPLEGDPRLVASIGGKLFSLDVTSPNKTVTDISVTGVTLASTPDLVWFAQANKYLVMQNGLDRAVIHDGANSRLAVTEQKEVPVGTVMAYGMGRLWVALQDGRSFAAGDIIYGSSGTPGEGFRDAVLKFTENDVLNGGGAFAVPLESGDITAMQFVGNIDTSTGQGPLQVFTSSSTFSVQAPFDRTVWQNLTNPIQTISISGVGSVGQVVPVNGDLWFRAEDGIRSFQTARREFGSWTSTPLSNEMNRVIAEDDRSLLKHVSSVVFDNRLLTTVSPQWEAEAEDGESAHGYGVYHLGLAVLDFDPVSGMFQRDMPTWNGIWTGLNILQVVVGKFEGRDRCFLFCLNSSKAIELWELSLDEKWDSTDNEIEWAFELPSYRFGDEKWELKELEAGDFWIDRLATHSGGATFDVFFRPDSRGTWVRWADQFSLCATATQCDTECVADYPVHEQYRPRQRLPRPTDTCESYTGKPLNRGFSFGVLFVISGFCRMNQFRLQARKVPEDVDPACPSSETCTIHAECDSAYSLYNYTTTT